MEKAAGTENSPPSAKLLNRKARRNDSKEIGQKSTSKFVQKAPPKSKKHKTYNTLAKIKGKKTKPRRSLARVLKYVDRITLEKVNSDWYAGKFLETTWNGEAVQSTAYERSEALCIDDLRTLDSTDEKFIMVVDESQQSLRLFAKASRKMAKQHLARSNIIESTRKFVEESVRVKPSISRGCECGSVDKGYAIYGTRPNRMQPGLGVYAFKSVKKKVSYTETELNQAVDHIVEEMEKCLLPTARFFELERSVMTQIVEKTGLKTIGKWSPAFSIGKEYHSKCHVDADFYYTHLTVVGPAEVNGVNIDDDEVIYFFIFPTYGIKIPLRSGDTLMFNPTVLHSCSNPKYPGCYIMSAFVSRRTILRADPVL